MPPRPMDEWDMVVFLSRVSAGTNADREGDRPTGAGEYVAGNRSPGWLDQPRRTRRKWQHRPGPGRTRAMPEWCGGSRQGRASGSPHSRRGRGRRGHLTLRRATRVGVECTLRLALGLGRGPGSRDGRGDVIDCGLAAAGARGGQENGQQSGRRESGCDGVAGHGVVPFDGVLGERAVPGRTAGPPPVIRRCLQTSCRRPGECDTVDLNLPRRRGLEVSGCSVCAPDVSRRRSRCALNVRSGPRGGR